MSFLDKPVSEMSQSELQRLIREEIARQVPPIPQRLLELTDNDHPLLQPDSPLSAEVMTYDAVKGRWTNGKIVAESIEAVLNLASALVAGSQGAARVEVGYGVDEDGEIDTSEIGIRAYSSDGTTATLLVDAVTGSVYVKGRFDFGTSSRLTSDDLVELQQIASSGFMTPTKIQEADQFSGAPGTSSATATCTWSTPTTSGNFLLMSLAFHDPDGTVPTPTTPSGWTLVTSKVANPYGLYLYRASTGASRGGTESITLNDNLNWTLQLFEYNGVAIGAADKTATNNGDSASPDSGTTATTTSADQLWVGLIMHEITEYKQGSFWFDAPYMGSLTNDFEEISSEDDDPGDTGTRHFPSHRQYLLAKNVTATGAANVSGTLEGHPTDNTWPWLGLIATFPAKAVSVDAPEADKLRLYAKSVDGEAYLHVKDEADTESAVVLGKKDEIWRMELVAVTRDFGSVAAHSGGSYTETISGLVVGDYCFFMGASDGANVNSFVIRTRPVCTATNSITVDYYNGHTAGLDPASMTHTYLVIHRS